MPDGSASLRITFALMALISIAKYIASRTRTSANGFLPLMLEVFSSGADWFMPRKIVRSSGPVSVLVPSLLSTRPRSCTGIG